MSEFHETSEFHYVQGRLAYRRASDRQIRGREDWQLTLNRDGSRTMRCLAMTDDSELVRDVLYTLDPAGRPLDAYIRLQAGSRWVGSGYLRVSGSELRVTTDSPETGATTQVLQVPERFHIMTHAVMLDGWTFWAYDHEQGGEQEVAVYNTSTRWNGTDGPLGRLEPLRVSLVGEEEHTVPAGTFPARRYHVASDVVEAPPADLWVAGDDHLLLRYNWPELDLEYLLAVGP